jgi:hypothetical protein
VSFYGVTVRNWRFGNPGIKLLDGSQPQRKTSFSLVPRKYRRLCRGWWPVLQVNVMAYGLGVLGIALLIGNLLKQQRLTLLSLALHSPLPANLLRLSSMVSGRRRVVRGWFPCSKPPETTIAVSAAKCPEESPRKKLLELSRSVP